jgi:hypothetical protein
MAGMGKVALNEWLLSGWRTDHLNGRLWAFPVRPLPCLKSDDRLSDGLPRSSRPTG